MARDRCGCVGREGSTSSNRSKSMIAACCDQFPRGLMDNAIWNALPDGSYFIEWRENSKRRRLPAGTTVAQAAEVQRRKQAELGALASAIIAPRLQTEDVKKAPLQALIDRYLDQIQTLKKPNTFRKYDGVLKRFAKDFVGQTLDTISVEDLNDFLVKLKKGGMSPNTVLHNVIIIAQFFRRNGRPGITRLLQLPERTNPPLRPKLVRVP